MVDYAGFFDDAGKARSVIDTMKGQGYRAEELLLVEPGSGDELKKTLSNAVNRNYLSKGAASQAKAGLEAGKTLAVIKARLGNGRMVESLLADNGVTMLGTYTSSGSHFFFSDIIGMPMLSDSRMGNSGGPPSANKPLTGNLFPLLSKSPTMGMMGQLSKSPTMGMMGQTMKPLVTSFIPLLWKR